MNKNSFISNSKPLEFAIRCALFVVLFILMAELFFRFIVPARELSFVKQNAQFMILHYDQNAAETGLTTSGRFAQNRSRWRINNYGWNSAIDYQPADERSRPTAVIIGDSYIAGYYVDWQEHVAAQLHAKTQSELLVYSLGMHGVSLAEHISVARYAKHHLDPDIYIFSVNADDLEASLHRGSGQPGGLKLSVQDGEITEVQPRTFSSSKTKSLIKYSALARYLILNANINPDTIALRPKICRTEGDVPKADEPKQPFQPAATYIFQRLREELPDATLIVAIDGNREELYKTFPERPNSIEIKPYIEQAAAGVGAYSLDLNNAFFKDYQENEKRFDFPYDYHWNARGNEVVAEALYHLIDQNRLFETN